MQQVNLFFEANDQALPDAVPGRGECVVRHPYERVPQYSYWTSNSFPLQYG